MNTQNEAGKLPQSSNDWRSTLVAGAEVYWTDPNDGICSGHRTIAEIVSDSGKIESDETVVRLNDNGSVTEAFAGELSALQPGERKLSEVGLVVNQGADCTIMENGETLSVSSAIAGQLVDRGLIYDQGDDPAAKMYHIVDGHSFAEVEKAIGEFAAGKLPKARNYRPLHAWTVGGSAEGYVVDLGAINVKNWLAGQGLDDSEVERVVSSMHVSVGSKEIAVLKSINVDDDMRGGGIGNDLLNQILGDAGSAAVLLVADRAESQEDGFDLKAWYERNDFAQFADVSTGPMMIRPASLAAGLSSAMQGKVQEKQYLIFSQSEAEATTIREGFWSNEHGWCDFTEATYFTEAERAALSLPESAGRDAKWVSAEEMAPFFKEQNQHAAGAIASARLSAGTQFFQELLDSVETLDGIVEQHGSRTLCDLMYLQNAIMKGCFIDHYEGESSVRDVVKALPSAERWLASVQVQEAEHTPSAPSLDM
ncbi:hypothetical protein [Paraburkholderia youngii]|uniref:hypothetical protein n=1 Tax=Paraburkholderia youngii TaxID=2782701 RepID=UPI003D1CD76A